MNEKLIGSLLSRINSRTQGFDLGTPLRTPPDGVTIGIPNWNHEFFLPKSISAALQTVRLLREHGVPAEIVVVDDNSRDGSLTLLRQLEALYYEDGLRVHAFAENSGLPVARNYIILNASYRYVVFLDADNSLMPENMYQFYRAMKQTSAAVVYGNLLCRIYETDELFYITNNQSFQPRIFNENYIDACAMFDRAQVFDVGSYASDTNVYAHEDWELYLHLVANGRRLVFVPLIFGTYYANPDSMLQQTKVADMHSAIQKHIRRVFDQTGLRQEHMFNSLHLRYHPDIGYI